MLRITLLLFLLMQPAITTAQAGRVGQVAQSGEAGQGNRRHWAYGFMSPGFTNDPEKTALWELGAGYEWLVARSLGIRGDAAVMVAGVEGMDFGFPLTLNAAYYLRQAPIGQRQFTPFITGGYTRGGFSTSSNMFNIGAGLNQWTTGCCGFRFEILHHVKHCGSGSTCRRDWYLDARLGFVVNR